MGNATKWAALLHRYLAGSSRKSVFRISFRRFFRACLAGLSVFVLAGSFAQAATIHGGDILVVDATGSKLFRVDPATGARTVISDFQDPSQGRVDGSLSGVAIRRGHILVTAAATGIYAVNPHNGHRTLVSDFTRGTLQGDVFGSAVDASGRVLVDWARPQPGSYPTGIVRVNLPKDTQVLVSDLANPAQGKTSGCCGERFTDLAVEKSGSIVAGAIWITCVPAGPPGSDCPPVWINGGVYRIDPVTGNRSLLSYFGTGLVPTTGIAVESSGDILVNAQGEGKPIFYSNKLMRIDPKSGERSVLSDFDNPGQGPIGSHLGGLAVEDSGQGGIIVGAGKPFDVYAVATMLFRVDPKTGLRSLLSDSSDPKQGPSFARIAEIAVVPKKSDDAGFDSEPPKNSFANPFGLGK